MRHRTEQGRILEKLLHGMKHRYTLCWNGDSTGGGWGSYDCACCITYIGGDDTLGCGCVCHARIESMANSRDMLMFLLALKGSTEMPFIPKDYADWMTYNRKIFAEHEEHRKKQSNTSSDGKCCDACEMVWEMEAKHKEHTTNPAYFCGKSCHVCDEWRAAHKPSKKKKV